MSEGTRTKKVEYHCSRQQGNYGFKVSPERNTAAQT
jgi:hypothetical protein